jgi:pyroglutamyl-peptidase
MQGKSTILITGFGPFPGMPENASALFAVKLAHLAARRFRGRRVVSRVLATEWEGAPRRLAELYRRERPKLALHFGVSERTAGFAIETTARNVRGPLADATGARPTSPWILREGPEALVCPLPYAEIVARLSARGLPAHISEDAGAYLCNAVFYAALAECSAPSARTRAGLVHIPAALLEERAAGRGAKLPSGDAPRLDWEGALIGGLEIIRTCLGLPPPADGAGKHRIKARQLRSGA